MKKILLAVTTALISTSVLADYNANISGELAGVYTYDYQDSIYIRLKNQPTSHPACDPSFFVIDGAVPADRRKAMLSRLLVALASAEPINLGYDATGNCVAGYIHLHRAG